MMPIVFATAMDNMMWSIGLEVTLAVLGFTNINIPTIGTTLYWANNHSAMVVGVWWWILIPVVLIVITFIGLFLLAVSHERIYRPAQPPAPDGSLSHDRRNILKVEGLKAYYQMNYFGIEREVRAVDDITMTIAQQRGLRHCRRELVGQDQLHQGAGRRDPAAAADRGRVSATTTSRTAPIDVANATPRRRSRPSAGST